MPSSEGTALVLVEQVFDTGRVPGDAATVTALRALVERTRPVSLAHQRTLPVLPALEELLPDRGLRRGTVVQVAGATGATTVALAVVAGPTRAGSWAAVVGLSELGWVAAAEAGVDLEHVVAVRTPPRSWTDVVAALVDAFDVVVCGPDHAPSAGEVRRLASRARERGAVLVTVGGAATSVAAGRPARRAWPDPDVRLVVSGPRWSGLGQGWGALRGRRVTVAAEGRGALARPRRVDLWLPGPAGIQVAEPIQDGVDPGCRAEPVDGVVVPFRRVG